MTSRVIQVAGVNEALVEGFWWLKAAGLVEQSRNGPVLVASGPVITEYSRPWERVLFDDRRDANPVFHLMEAIWVVAGSDDVRFLEQFNSRYREYADPGTDTVWGAYGARLKDQGQNQIDEAIRVLSQDLGSRQAVLSMWDPFLDLGTLHNDRPCNTHIYLDCRNQRVNLTVCCRSNDMLWGAYGANMPVFSVLQELISHALGLEMGVLRQFSNNFHIYTDIPQVQDFLVVPPAEFERAYPEVIPLVADGESWRDFVSDCQNLVAGRPGAVTRFMRDVALPLHAAYLARKRREPWSVAGVPECDWKIAFLEWADRRIGK